MNYWYIPLSPDEKRPLRNWSWDGWPLDFDRPEVVSEVDKNAADYDWWARVGNTERDLLVIDIDRYKMDEETQEAIDQGWQGILDRTQIVKSQSGGLHVYVRVDTDRDELLEGFESDNGWQPIDHVDLKGSVGRGYAVSPEVDGYEIVNDEDPVEVTRETIYELPVFEECEFQSLDYDPEDREYDGPDLSVWDVIPKSEYPPERRTAAPEFLHDTPSSTNANFMVDPGGETYRDWRHQVTANAWHLLGIKAGILDCGDSLSRDTWEEIKEYGIEEGHLTSVPQIPDLNALNIDDARRYARQHDIEWPSTPEVRERLQNRIQQAITEGEQVIIDSPTASGKTHTIAGTPWTEYPAITGGEPVVHLHQTTDARDDARRISWEEDDIVSCFLEARNDACPVARGDFDDRITVDDTPVSAWIDQKCDYRGIPFRQAHAEAEYRSDQEFPCQPDCPAQTQWDGVPRDEDGEPGADVIHATHQFAYVPSLIRDSHVILDEQPNFSAEITTDRVREMVTAYLQTVDAPIDTWEELIQTAKEQDTIDSYLSIAAEISQEPDQNWYFDQPGAHTLAPAVTEAVWTAYNWGSPDENSRIRGHGSHTPPAVDHEQHISVTVVLNADTNTIKTVRVVPDFTIAESVICLEERPQQGLWELNTGIDDLAESPVLNTHERTLWRRYERSLLTVQVGDSDRPLASGEYYHNSKTKRLINRIREIHGDDFQTAITAKAVEEDVESAMQTEGIEDPQTMHYRNTRSRNEFAGEGVGVIIGSSEPGDGPILDLCAELGLDAQPETATCRYCDGVGCSNCDDGEYRVPGRGFEGPDADTATQFLHAYREREVSQAAGRYAREAADPDDHAIVYLWTAAVPSGFVDVDFPEEEIVPHEKTARVLEYVRDNPGVSAREVAEETDTSKPWVIEVLDRYDHIEKNEGTGDHGATLWRAIHDKPRSLTTGNNPPYLELTISSPDNPAPSGHGDRPDWRDVLTPQQVDTLDSGD